MTESSNADVEGRAVVVQRTNELSECVRILEELGIPTEILTGGLPTADQLVGASVVVLHASRLAETGTPNLSLWPRTIAVVDEASKTMLAHINRLGVALTVRRPIHPRTLRLLLLHEIYRGPERRRKPRILIGHPIKVAAGLFTRRATLLELSSGGARIELPYTPKVGSKVKLYVGKDLTLTKPIKLQAKVVRCIRPSGENGRSEAEVGVALLDPKREAKIIHAILERFATGPASWQGKIDSPASSAGQTPVAAGASAASPDDSASQERSLPPSVSSLPPARTAPSAPEPVAEVQSESSPEPDVETAVDAAVEDAAAPEEHAPVESEINTTVIVDEDESEEPRAVFAMPPPDEDSDERRRDPRIPYDRRVVALGEEAARVLVGRDLSQGGMRIAASDAVDLGDTLRVALHCGTEMEPLVLLATADRDDGEEGTVLGFHDLTDGQKDHLEKIIANSSPIQSATDEDDPNARTGSIVLGEMIETVKKGPTRPPEAIETEEQIDAHLDSIFDTD